MIMMNLCSILNQFLLPFLLVSESPTPSTLISSIIFPTSSSFFSSSIVTPTPTVPPGK